jgi:alkylated DNA repair dioxygenase AlkB
MIPGLYISHNVLTKEECSSILDEVNLGSWRLDLNRRTQHYGVRYDYKTRGLSYDVDLIKGSVVERITTALLPIWSSLSKNTIGNVIVNEYTRGQKIAKHIDSPKFGDVVMTLSLGASATMVMTSSDEQVIPIELHSGTVVALTGLARSQYSHQILPLKDTRVSITFRSI